MPCRTICPRDDAAAINGDRARGCSLRDISGRYGVARNTLDRHFKKCVAQELALALGRAQDLKASRPAVEAAVGRIRTADELLSHIDELRAEAIAILEDEKRAGTAKGRRETVALMANLDLLIAKALGVIKSGSTTTIDARRQTVNNYAPLSTDELRAIASAHSVQTNV